jgi:hypothetical protein
MKAPLFGQTSFEVGLIGHHLKLTRRAKRILSPDKYREKVERGSRQVA